MKKKWWHDSVVYQIYPRSFKDSNGDGIGDLKGITEKLGYLKHLGIDVIWLCPVYASPNKDNGYDISDYYDIMDCFGTMEDFDELLEKAHELGIKIIMDLVVNHVSDQHKWFLESKDNKDSPYRDYFVWQEGPVNDLESTFSGSAWEEYPKGSNDYYLHLFTKEQPDLNWNSQAMRDEIYSMMNFWLDKGIDGFRMDVIDLIGKVPEEKITENGPRMHEFIQEMHEKTLKGRDVLTVGETWGATPEIGLEFSAEHRKELSMIFQFEHLSVDQQPGKTRWDLKDLDFKDLTTVLTKWQLAFQDDGWNSLFWDNHDTPRIVSRWGNDTEYRIESAKMFAILLHMMKGTPYIYQGEEIGMTNIHVDSIDQVDDVQSKNLYYDRLAKGYSHEELMQAVNEKGRDNARTPMQWDDSTYSGFSTNQPWLPVNPNYQEINVKESIEDKDSIFSTYQKLIQLRKENELVVYGNFEEVETENSAVYAYKRNWQGSTWLIVCNLSSSSQTTTLPDVSEKRVIISNYEKVSISSKKLKPFESFVVEI
ncbi:glycoside hydrolase family 13 protein [Vagococcus fluvialis]|uniref:glycoside hydrolase family 13 protein n=1 Tax=Vagococcus fluvialis TaxID=2738 RepID=UPI003B228E03